MNIFTEDHAAQLIGCSVALLRKWRGLKQGPAYCKVGRLVRYRTADLEAFLEQHRVATGGGQA